MNRAARILLSMTLSLGLLLPYTGAKVRAEGAEMELRYAENFTLDFLEDGAALLTVGEKEEYLLLPEGAAVPEDMENLRKIPIPAENIYLASSSAADLFLQAGALSAVRYSGTTADNWFLPEMREALRNGSILYAGKYSAPDYELLLTEGCGLVVENTMILHSPSTREKLQALGLPVLVEYSSYEPHPLGRVEWVRLYGFLSGHEEEAEAFFDRQEQLFLTATGGETGEVRNHPKTVAFFHITPNGSVVVRRRSDYVTRMIELAGGETAISELPEDDSALSTVTIQMESFYSQAVDADVLIYNGTTAGSIASMQELLALSPLLADFRAVREGNVWCTEMSMFQRSSAAAGIIADFRAILDGDTEETELYYLHRIR